MDLTVDEAVAALIDAGTFRFGGGAPIETIRAVEAALGEQFPAALLVWLLRYGGGGAAGSEISGVFADATDPADPHRPDDKGTILGDTRRLRESGHIGSGVVVILANDDVPPWCLVTATDTEGPRGVVAVDGDKVTPLYPDFTSFFADYVVAFAQEIGTGPRPAGIRTIR